MTQVYLARFPNEHDAAHRLAEMEADPDAHVTWLDGLVVVERHHSGRYATHVSHHSIKLGMALGGGAAVLVGLLFPPYALLWFLGLGATIGGITEVWRKDERLPGDALTTLQRKLEPGQSALLWAGPDDQAEEALARLDAIDGTIDLFHMALDPDATERLHELAREAEAQADAHPSVEDPHA